LCHYSSSPRLQEIRDERAALAQSNEAGQGPRPKEQIQRDIDELSKGLKKAEEKVKKLKEAGKDPSARSQSKFAVGTSPQEVLDTLKRSMKTLKKELEEE
jgi:hypothetical protein